MLRCDRTALTASRYIYDYCLLFGIPEKLYSDQDPAYESNLFKHLMTSLGVEKLRTSGYNPKANGQCEKTNDIIKKYLLKYVNLFGGEWDLYLNELAYAYNTSIHTSSGFSPAELSFGRKLRIPIDVMYGFKTSETEPFNITEFKEKLTKMYDLANESMGLRQAKYINYHDKKVYDDVIPEGQLVYMYLPRKTREKLSLKWHGLCKILTQKHPVYEIEYTRMNKKCRKWITRDKLRRCENNVVYQDINIDNPIEIEKLVAEERRK